MARWSLLVVTPTRATVVDLPSNRATVLGRGPTAHVDLEAPALAERLVSLTVREAGVMAEVVRGARGVRLNDVQLARQVVLRPGDELQAGPSSAVLLGIPSRAARSPRLAPADELDARLFDEVRRATVERPVAFALLSVATLNAAARQALVRRVVDDVEKGGVAATFGELAPGLLGAVLPELERDQVDEVLEHLRRAAGPRARVVAAAAPRDADTADALDETVLDALLGPADTDEVVRVDPYMVRLSDKLVSLAERPEPVVVVGPSGAGRTTALLEVAAAAGVTARVVRASQPALLEPALAARAGGALLVRGIDGLPPPEHERLLARAHKAKLRLLATASRPLDAKRFPFQLEVPPLRARPLDVLPLAELVLASARRRTGRARLVLSDEARRLFSRYRWPGQVRELKNVVTRAALATVRDEIGRDALPLKLSAEVPVATLKGALESTERELLLETLSRTRWNVSQAALRLGVPRRTIVYRMSRLGLRRPAR